MVRYCQVCGCELTTERKYCKECRKARKREYAKKHYKEQQDKGIIKKRYGTTTCCYCGKELVKTRPWQTAHLQCTQKNIHKSVDNYNHVKRAKGGNTVGRQTIIDLGFVLNCNIVVHHIDENPDNNTLSNLIIMGRKEHAQLHRLLEKNWSLLSKDSSSNLENCWNILRGQLTKAYLETKGANVIKITDIGQSAAEPLNENNIYVFLTEEGSETMHQTPKE